MNQVTVDITVLVFCLLPLHEPRKAVFSLILVRGMSCRHARTIPVTRNSDTNMDRWISDYITIEHMTLVSPSVKTTETNDWLMLFLFEKWKTKNRSLFQSSSHSCEHSSRIFAGNITIRQQFLSVPVPARSEDAVNYALRHSLVCTEITEANEILIAMIVAVNSQLATQLYQYSLTNTQYSTL
jgi:hypothetical protein